MGYLNMVAFPVHSEQALINWIYLCHEQLIITVLYFMQTVQDGLPQVFIKPIGFTIETLSKDIIYRHFCGLSF